MKNERSETEAQKETTDGGCNVRSSALLAACPCGCTPSRLSLVDNGQGGKWAEATGNCCGEWAIEFRTEYNDLDTAACYALAVAAWNAAPRTTDAEKLAWIAGELCDSIGGIDLHEQAAIYASAFGRDEPNQFDYAAAVRDGIDEAQKAANDHAQLRRMSAASEESN